MTAPSARPLRADAQRNRDRLLEAAAAAFAAGTEVSLEEVARQAGVGIGTLYRNFATREELVEAVYRNELARLCDRAPDLLAGSPADVALRRWMDGLIDYLATKHGMADALQAMLTTGETLAAESRVRLLGAVDVLLSAGVADGTLRSDSTSWDVLSGVSGVSLVTPRLDQREQADRLLDLLLDGLRYRAGS